MFANKTKTDIILEKELKSILGSAFVNILSDEHKEDYAFGLITEKFLKANISDFNQQFYICGPPPMIDAVEQLLLDLGVDKKLITIESY